MSQIQISCPFEISCTEDNTGQIEFDTFIGYATNVSWDRTCTDAGRNRCRLVVQQVFGDTAEVFYGTVQAAAEQFEVETCIEGVGCFPSQVFVSLVGQSRRVLSVAV